VLHDPELVEIGIRRSPAETVTHAVYPVAAEQKFDLLMALLERTNFDSVLIFCRTKQNADRVSHFLKHPPQPRLGTAGPPPEGSGAGKTARGAGAAGTKHAVAVLHSNRTQRERIEALEGFKSGKYEVMVATDIASRGLDIAGVSHVINYDVPEHPEDYVHRIGRTGRAQNVGDAFTLMSGQELPALQAIEHFIGRKIPRLKLENFPYLYTALFEPESAAGGRRAITGRRTHRGYSFGRRR
jgi:ATP-dependent RNA helicase RhlE